jgi:hypothetical protein
VSAFYSPFPTILFDELEALAFAVNTLANIEALRLRIEKSLYKSIGFACSMNGCGETSRISNSLACFLQMPRISATFF